MKKLLIALALANLYGCASIVSGTSQSVSIKTTHNGSEFAAANCKLENDKGTWFVPVSPGSVVVHKSYGDLTISCEKAGTPTGISTFSSSAIGMAAGNIVFGGAIGVGVDMASGAAYEYPNLMTVEMGVVTEKAVKAVAQPTDEQKSRESFGRPPETPSQPASLAAVAAAPSLPLVLVATAAPVVDRGANENFPGLVVTGDAFAQHVGTMKAFQARAPGGSTLEISMSDQQVWVHNLERGGRATGTYHIDSENSHICFVGMRPGGFAPMSTCYELQQLDATTFQWKSVDSKYFLRYIRSNG